MSTETLKWISAIKAYSHNPMIKRYVLQYVFPRDDGKPDRKVIDEALPEIRKQLSVFDAAYGKRDFLVGDQLSLADLMLAPILFYVATMPEGKELVAAASNVRRAQERIAQRESFQATLPPKTPPGK